MSQLAERMEAMRKQNPNSVIVAEYDFLESQLNKYKKVLQDISLIKEPTQDGILVIINNVLK